MKPPARLELMTSDQIVQSLKHKDRDCGQCTFCCTAPAINDWMSPTEMPPKPAGDKCSQCTALGCGIYPNRPEVCSGFLCGYLLGWDVPRPDQCGVAWSYQIISGTLSVMGFVTRPVIELVEDPEFVALLSKVS